MTKPDIAGWKCLLMAGMGGIMPTATKLAASLVANPMQAMPATGFYIGVGLYFVIGAVVCVAFAERNVKQAFLAGIAAPALIASIISGVADSQNKLPQTPEKSTHANNLTIGTTSVVKSIIVTAHADAGIETPEPNKNGIKESASTGTTEGGAKDAHKLMYIIVPIQSGSTDWRLSDMKYKLTLKDAAGNVKTVELGSSMYTFVTDQPLTEVRVQTDAQTNTLEILDSKNKGGQIFIQSNVQTRKDFLWALGAKGKPIVHELKAQFVPAK